MQPHHAFVCSSNKGAEADLLVQRGLAEGSNRVHEGQGTQNRKFYFPGFFLEILWVHDAQAFAANELSELGLAARNGTGISNAGLCLVREEASDALFEDAHRHQPTYFPAGQCIDVVHPLPDALPFLFRLPFDGAPNTHNEPLAHPCGIQKLTAIHFTAPSAALSNSAIRHFKNADRISFATGAPALALQFDGGKQQQHIELPSLRLSLEY